MIKNQWALGALVAGILTIVIELLVGTGGVILLIITVICSIIGLVKYKKTPEIGGKWLSILALCIIVIYIAILFLPILGNLNINNSGTTTSGDRENIIGTWIDEYGFWYTLYLENGTSYTSKDLTNITDGNVWLYKMENGLLYELAPEHYPDWDKALDWKYQFQNNNNTLVLREPWWDDSYDDVIYYRVD